MTATPQDSRNGTDHAAPQHPRDTTGRNVRRPFRPSDWAEWLVGAMSCFRPDGAQRGIGACIGSSTQWCGVLCVINGLKCVIVNEALEGIELMASEFVMNFTRDNQRQLTEACLLSEPPERT